MFVRYQHVERLGNKEVEGITQGYCYVFPKIDGTNGSVWLEDGEVRCGSRRRELSDTEDNQGFREYINLNVPVTQLLCEKPNWYLYGEWLVPHTLKTYREDAWRKFYVFDVVIFTPEDGASYVPYYAYWPVLEHFGVDYIPCLAKAHNPSKDQLFSIVERNDFLMRPGEIGEGIVIKNYDWSNCFGRQTWAKIVRSEFKEKHIKAMGPAIVNGKAMIEEYIAEKWVTPTLVDKERAKIEKIIEDQLAAGQQASPIQPRLLGTVYHCLLREELVDIVRKLKNPTIDFRLLQRCVTNVVKQHARDLF